MSSKLPAHHNRRALQLKDGLLPAGLLVFTLFIFGPFTIYFWNAGQLDVSYLSVLSILAPLASVGAVLLLIPAYWLPATLFRFYNPLLLGIGVALWLQGNVIVGSYGLLDGTDIDFAAQAWRMWPETALWLGLPALLVILYGKRKEAALFAARIVLALQVVHLTVGGFAYPGVFADSAAGSMPVEVPVFSSRQNVLHLVLDGFQSDVFAEVLERFPELVPAFEGFVFFENSMGSFASTRMSIPAILSGQVYRNQVPMDEFMSQVMSDETLPAVLHRNGYIVDIVTLWRYRYGENYSSWSSVMRPFTAGGERLRLAAAEVLDLSLFRHLPHFLKPRVYRNQNWLLQSWGPLNLPADRRFQPSNAIAFMKHFRDLIRVGDERPRYKFIHLMVPHLPLVLDSDCNFLEPRGEDRIAYLEQSACAVRVLVDLLNDLRTHGLYHDTTILVSTDHGNGFPSESVSSRFEEAKIVSKAAALLLVKPPRAEGSLTRSRAPVSLADIPDTVADLAGIPRHFSGKSVLQVGEADRRDRRYYHHDWKPLYWSSEFFPELREYLVDGDIFDPSAWKYLGVVLPRQEAPYSSFFRVDLGEVEDRKYLGTGWSEDDVHLETSYVFALGETASVNLPRNTQDEVLLSARLAPAPPHQPLVITVLAEDREIARWKVHPGVGWGVYSALLPASGQRAGKVNIRFRFSDVVGPRRIAAAFDYVQIRPATERGAPPR